MHGSSNIANMIRSTVAFLPASLNSLYKDYREFSHNDIGLQIAAKHFTNLAMKGLTIISIPALISWLLRPDDDDEELRPVYEEAMFSYYNIGGEEYKHKTQYLLGLIFEKAPKMAYDAFVKDQGERAGEVLLAGMWTMLMPDATPTVLAPFLDIAMNEKFTGSPVIPRRLQSLKGDEKFLQFTDRTPEMYKIVAENLKDLKVNASPLEMQHVVTGYFGYFAKWVEDGTNWLLWNEEEYGEEAHARDVIDHLAHHFKYKDYGQTYYSQKYYDEKDKLQSKSAVLTQAKNMMKAGKTKEAKRILTKINIGQTAKATSDILKLDKKISIIRKQELKIQYDKNLTGDQKEAKLLELHTKIGKMQKQGYEEMIEPKDVDFKIRKIWKEKEERFYKEVNKTTEESQFKEAIKWGKDSAKELRDLKARAGKSKEDMELYRQTWKQTDLKKLEKVERIRKDAESVIRKHKSTLKALKNLNTTEKYRSKKTKEINAKIDSIYKRGLKMIEKIK